MKILALIALLGTTGFMADKCSVTNAPGASPAVVDVR